MSKTIILMFTCSLNYLVVKKKFVMNKEIKRRSRKDRKPPNTLLFPDFYFSYGHNLMGPDV